jgi:hypothetical protein
MKYLIRAAFTALSLATIPAVANAAPVDQTSVNQTPVTIQDTQATWANG